MKIYFKYKWRKLNIKKQAKESLISRIKDFTFFSLNNDTFKNRLIMFIYALCDILDGLIYIVSLGFICSYLKSFVCFYCFDDNN